jgi:hypothetical protein
MSNYLGAGLMSLSRRQILAAGGGGIAMVAVGGLWRATRLPTTATDPWKLPPPPPADIRLDAFRHAILAPNPHNRQPWLIRLDGDDGATLFCDLDRRLPMTDPFDRQITIGFGCFLELMRIAAAERGIRIDQSWFPDGEPHPRLDSRPVARLTFEPDASVTRDPLFAAIPRRRSTKTVFKDWPVDANSLQRLGDSYGMTDEDWFSVSATADPDQVARIRKLVLEAVDIEMLTQRAHRESVDLMRIGAREVDANPDGIALVGPPIEAMAATGVLDRAALADPASTAFRQGEALMAETYGSAPAFLSVATAGNSRGHQLLAGTRYARANLIATEMGLAMHPMSQSLQEYPEMGEVFTQMQALLRPVFGPGITGTLRTEGGRVQMLARIGHAAAVQPTPRWPLETRLV